MTKIQKRFLLFLLGCIGTRSLLVYIAKTTNKTILRYMGVLALLPFLGFFYIYFMGLRKIGMETFGDNIWWDKLRPLHGILYGLFAYNAIIGNSYAWIYLLIDLIIGLTSFLIFHYTVGDFNKLF